MHKQKEESQSVAVAICIFFFFVTSISLLLLFQSRLKFHLRLLTNKFSFFLFSFPFQSACGKWNCFASGKQMQKQCEKYNIQIHRFVRRKKKYKQQLSTLSEGDLESTEGSTTDLNRISAKGNASLLVQAGRNEVLLGDQSLLLRQENRYQRFITFVCSFFFSLSRFHSVN